MPDFLRFALQACLLLALSACGGDRPEGADDATLLQLEAVARHLTGPRHLRASAYPDIRTSDRPSELVSFLFSDIGVAEWPPVDSGPATASGPLVVQTSEMEREQMRSTRTPMFPADGALVHARPDLRIGKQLVLSGDDSSGEIVAEAYLDPNQPPAYTRRWTLPAFSKPPRGG